MSGVIPARGGGREPDRQPTADFFLCDIFDASPKDDMASMEHPLFSLATRPDRRILSYDHNGTRIEVVPSVKGLATIHDKDILIYCISQLMAAMNAGRSLSRTLHLRAHDLLVATNRETSGDGYKRLREAFERLAGTRITTNYETGGHEVTTGFGLIESWQIVRKSRGGRMVSVAVTLSEWLWRAVLSKSVLTLSREYFQLHKKSGSASPRRVFRRMLRDMIAADLLPDYHLSEEPGDVIRASPRASMVEPPVQSPRPQLAAATLDAARATAPGADVYALQAEWEAMWRRSGSPVLRSPDRAFLGWLARRGEG